jgi:hypothetical protein
MALVSCLIHPPRHNLQKPEVRRLVRLACLWTVRPALICGIGIFQHSSYEGLNLVALAMLVLALVIVSLSPRVMAGLALVFALFALSVHNSHMLAAHRNFYGVLRVFDNIDTREKVTVRALYHGSTEHGQEQVKPEIDITPNGYYVGPLQDLMTAYHPKNVGLIGLGTGTMLCFQAPGRHFTVYDIDPAVAPVAYKWFDYMKTCGVPTLMTGDGRRLLQMSDTNYDMLTIDAFTSDAIPIHLLTEEAFRIYFAHIKPGGVLGIHISNRFYDLRYPISDVIAALNYRGLYKIRIPPTQGPLDLKTEWAVIARDDQTLKPLEGHGWHPLPPPDSHAWSDDYSDTLSALYMFHRQVSK